MSIDADLQPELLERFFRYVGVETTSDARAESYPSTPNQLVLLEMLAEELRALGVPDVRMDEHGYVMAKLPSNLPADRQGTPVPTVGFVAHVDTSPDVTAKGVNPIVHEGYDGGVIELPNYPGQRLDPEEQPALATVVGHTLVTTDGTTLLGADDKAGVAEIMTAVAWLQAHPEIPHGDIAIGFTPDEEIGRGTQHFDLEAFGAKYAYTLDGADGGCVEYETFSADMAKVSIEGRSEHPGTAKGKMVSAIKLAADFLARLPQGDLSPETTEGREGFVHPTDIEGTVQQVVLTFILRDFATEKLDTQHTLLERIADEVVADEPRARITIDVVEQYRNMCDEVSKVPFVVDHAREAIRRAGLEPFSKPVRGGTDGSRLTAMGLPTPNLFTGGRNFHSRLEWASVDEMVKAVHMIVELVQIWAERGEPTR